MMAHQQSDPSLDATRPATPNSQYDNPTVPTATAPQASSARVLSNTTAATNLLSAQVSVQQTLLVPVQSPPRPSPAERPVDPIIEELTRRYNESLRISDADQQTDSETPDQSGFAAYLQKTMDKLTMIAERPFTSDDAKARLMRSVAQIQGMMPQAVALDDETMEWRRSH